MVAFIIGLLFILFAVYACLPFSWSPGWWNDVLVVLRGVAPLLAFFIGLIAAFIGIADMKDRAQAKKEETKAGSE